MKRSAQSSRAPRPRSIPTTSGRRTSETSPTPSRRSRISTPARRAWRSRSTRCAAAATQTSASTSPARRSARSSCGSDAPDYADYAAKPATSDSSLLCGEAGILTVAFRLAPSDELADRLFARVRENVHNEANELAWGSPGTMLAAHAMHAWTGEQRWRDAWTESADELRSRRGADGLWTQRFGDREQRLLGSAHGAVGNQLALLQGSPVEDARDVGELLERAAVVEGPLANWPTGEEHRRLDPGAVVPRRTGDRHLRGLVLAGGALPRRRRAHVAGGRPRERARALPRHGGQRLRAPEGLRAHRRRALARPRAALRDARPRASRASEPPAPLPLHRRRRSRALRRRLPRRARARSRSSTAGTSSPSG